ncbi:MAG: hypothetical protein KC588_18335, partial [Nitrospira sp.]|nr:hypothetical protein [Nitrospira sp.]
QIRIRAKLKEAFYYSAFSHICLKDQPEGIADEEICAKIHSPSNISHGWRGTGVINSKKP